ncbi:hypothetical protein [Neobittarella massiliensis]|uniref:hypothetical protein n=1 Tax=Neobittarella massiliensis (ex Bilen et al. 2018) TaxID=2041842 RepID=UPI000CF67ABD|nr:hypothetical protein [Neobittarella massiliensis]
MEKLEKMRAALARYREGLRRAHGEAIEWEDYFKGAHWKYMKQAPLSGREPHTPFLLNAVWNKHADAMDACPSPVFLPRQPQDERGAELLGRVVPVLLDKLDFEQVYSDLWWKKLKVGAGCYGVFWDPAAGEIQVQLVDLMRLYFAPGCGDIQRSPYVFCLSLQPVEDMRRRWPQVPFTADSLTVRDSFRDFGADELAGKVCLCDCYYKKQVSGRQVVHLCKFWNEHLLYDSEADPAYAGRGIYDHGQYPFVLDVLLPKEGSPLGMGLCEVGASCQGYIDRLDYLIEENALIAGRQRFLVKNGAGVDMGQLADLRQNFVQCDLSVDDSAVRPLQAAPLPGFVQTHRDQKIAELKDILGNKDFMTGGVTGGVTAYGAIVALQEAGNKLSRDIIAGSYRAFKQVTCQLVWLIKQFYRQERTFYADGEFLKLGREDITPHLDIRVIAQKKNPFTTAAHNQLVLDLYKQGAFAADGAEAAARCVQAMVLEGKEEILKMLQTAGGGPGAAMGPETGPAGAVAGPTEERDGVPARESGHTGTVPPEVAARGGI